MNEIEISQKRKRPRVVRDLGPLHALMMKGLPDWIDEDGLMKTRELAKYIGVSYQGLYKWFERNSLSRKRVEALVVLSEKTVRRPDGFKPLTNDDFWEFM